jgi:hypothetical protein
MTRSSPNLVYASTFLHQSNNKKLYSFLHELIAFYDRLAAVARFEGLSL